MLEAREGEIALAEDPGEMAADARLVALDADAGTLTLDAVDVLDDTPVIDIKPYFASIDSFPDAMPPRHRDAP